MKKLTFILILFSLISLNQKAFGTAQIPDFLIYEGDTLSIYANPLESYFENYDIEKGGQELSINLIYVGLSVGGDDRFKKGYPSKYMLIRPSVGPGFEFGMPEWDTKTTFLNKK